MAFAGATDKIDGKEYPTDEMEPWRDVFDVVEELPDPKFEIPFDDEAVFAGTLQPWDHDCFRVTNVRPPS
jgi:hypothetical protein